MKSTEVIETSPAIPQGNLLAIDSPTTLPDNPVVAARKPFYMAATNPVPSFFRATLGFLRVLVNCQKIITPYHQKGFEKKPAALEGPPVWYHVADVLDG